MEVNGAMQRRRRELYPYLLKFRLYSITDMGKRVLNTFPFIFNPFRSGVVKMRLLFFLTAAFDSTEEMVYFKFTSFTPSSEASRLA